MMGPLPGRKEYSLPMFYDNRTWISLWSHRAGGAYFFVIEVSKSLLIMLLEASRTDERQRGALASGPQGAGGKPQAP